MPKRIYKEEIMSNRKTNNKSKCNNEQQVRPTVRALGPDNHSTYHGASAYDNEWRQRNNEKPVTVTRQQIWDR